MDHDERELKFIATPEKGEVSALLMRPENATYLLALCHGASTNIRHRTMQSIAEALADASIASFRYNFPYAEHGGGYIDKKSCIATVRTAAVATRNAAPELPLIMGGHSFSGRMTSTAASETPLEGVQGIVFFSFPLHMPGKPDTKRADHLANVSVPTLFLTGTRDELADLSLLGPLVNDLGPRATLHLLDTADHGYKILKTKRKSSEDVFTEMARVVRDWASGLM